VILRLPREKLRRVAAPDPDAGVIAERVLDRLRWAPAPQAAPVRYLVSGTAPRVDPEPDTAKVADRIIRRARGLDDIVVVDDGGHGWPPQR
jgi:hypothetical protein